MVVSDLESDVLGHLVLVDDLAHAHANEGVGGLVLYGSFLRGSDTAPVEVRRALCDLVRASWELGSRTLADIFAPELPSEEVGRVCRTQRVAASAAAAAELLELTYRVDISEDVGAIAVPSIVMHRRGDRTVPFECGRRLAAVLPGATLLPLAGNAHVPWRGDSNAVLEGIEGFLRGRVARSEDASHGEFRRIGDLWSVRFAGRRVLLKDAKGLRDLATLLANPRREVAAAALLQRAGGLPVERVEGVTAADKRALRAYKRRLRDVGEELADAEERNDLGHVARLLVEREAIQHELRSAVGLGGRRRHLRDPTDRARKAVTARLRSAMARISEVHPQLGEHLAATVSTGLSCRYSPNPPVSWWT